MQTPESLQMIWASLPLLNRSNVIEKMQILALKNHAIQQEVGHDKPAKPPINHEDTKTALR